MPCRRLVAERPDGGGRRANPGEASGDDLAGEARVLGQETIAGVHGVGAGIGGRLEDPGDVEVALRRALAAQRERLIGHGHVQRVDVVLAVDGDAGQPRVAARSYYPDRDLAAVGDQDLVHENDSSRLRRSLVRMWRVAALGLPGS